MCSVPCYYEVRLLDWDLQTCVVNMPQKTCPQVFPLVLERPQLRFKMPPFSYYPWVNSEPLFIVQPQIALIFPILEVKMVGTLVTFVLVWMNHCSYLLEFGAFAAGMPLRSTESWWRPETGQLGCWFKSQLYHLPAGVTFGKLLCSKIGIRIPPRLKRGCKV